MVAKKRTPTQKTLLNGGHYRKEKGRRRLASKGRGRQRGGGVEVH